ncbi:helix-turn-helix domain-containing protein [Cohnella yongneupensis]|uniref:Helix-turn-helix domain-containing protein n=1 Tax=Cohnella yongneupensis TaxID=425006 RepID=A0ABW0R255_9BACL
MTPYEPSSDSWEGPIFGDYYDKGDDYSHWRPDGMQDWLIAYTLSGEGYIRTPGGEVICGAGQVALLRAGAPHEYGTVRGKRWEFLWIHYPGLPENSYLTGAEVYIGTLPEGAVRERVESAFRRVLQDSLNRTELWMPLCENAIREVILLLAQRKDKQFDPRIEHTLQVLSRSMKEEIRVDDIARQIGLSVSRLSHLFKEQTGYSILEHVNRMRIRQAALLISHRGRNASEAAEEVGFNNYNHFAAQFRKVYGVSPRAYRGGRVE